MCGLAGIFGYWTPERAGEAVERMLRTQAHRGPDSSAVWQGAVSGLNVAVGFNRLKILDLSDAANQPMLSDDERFLLAFNGEIYNYVELRKELTDVGIKFLTRGDTEVLLRSLIYWGAAALTRLNGMWAFLLLDRVKGELLLARDRFGIKPLYTHVSDGALIVASEIKGILAASFKKFQVAANTANQFLRQSLLDASSATFFSEIYEFPAGHFTRMALQDIARSGFTPQRYWKIANTPEIEFSDERAIEAVRCTFIDSVKLRLRSDVPVGVLLSGGVDSSAIAAAVRHLEPKRDDIKLISAVADAGAHDEQPFIDAMSRHLKWPGQKVVLNYSPSEAFALLAHVSWFNDEPIGSFSTVAHYLLMNRAKDLGITVLLSGQGADELLCGYKKYLLFYLQELMASGHFLTASRLMAGFINTGSVLSQLNYHEAKRYLPSWLRLAQIDVRGSRLVEYRTADLPLGLNGNGVTGRQVADIERCSVPALVHYEDRMSMAVAREIRLPFLDFRLVSLLASLPASLKLRAGWTKWIFRSALRPLLPPEVAWRRDKQHFVVPQNQWLKNQLRDETQKLIKSEWVSEQLGLVDRRKFAALYDGYLKQSGFRRGIGFKDIFAPIALELWARRFERHLRP